MTRLTTGVVAVLLTLTAAGCSESGSGGTSSGSTNESTASSEASGGGSSDAVAWADEVCSGIADDIAALTTQPDIDPSNPQAAKDGLVTYLGQLETSLDGMASAVEDAGTPPVDGGEEAATSFLDQIGTAKEAVTSAKTKMEAAPVDDPAAFQTAATGAMQDLQALSEMEDPTSSFSDNPELKAAYDEAESCKALESGSSTPTS
jgi:hypothetical protein